ncbi:oxidoreductase [Mycena pura]|uniref:Oxidoreductase n=1 Tax=Mycena pura TaxID=153505 RepID=A0AAD6Y6C8_9AGAR|nr:oxidoreductase [Mycena pura]
MASQHTYITGGSSGLGLALSLILTSQGAHVSIVGCRQEVLDKALEAMEKCRKYPNQILAGYAFDLSTAEGSASVLDAVCKPHDDHSPDAIFTCAGTQKPMFFMDMTENDMAEGMVQGYWIQAWTVMLAAKKMVREGSKGKIILVSSTLGYMSFLGWASYAPAKHALRGLADTLQSEFMLYDNLDVHIFFPPAMFTPGFDQENTTKPRIVREIESTDDGVTPEAAAQALLHGIKKGHAHITADMITTLFRASTRGVTPRHNALLDIVYDIAAMICHAKQIIRPIWRWGVDKRVRAHRAEHRQHLQDTGFFTP